MARKKSGKKRTISPEQQAKMQAARAAKRIMRSRIKEAQVVGAQVREEERGLSEQAIKDAKRAWRRLHR